MKTEKIVVMNNSFFIGKDFSCGNFHAALREDGMVMTNGPIHRTGPTLTPTQARGFAEWILKNVPADSAD